MLYRPAPLLPPSGYCESVSPSLREGGLQVRDVSIFN